MVRMSFPRAGGWRTSAGACLQPVTLRWSRAQSNRCATDASLKMVLRRPSRQTNRRLLADQMGGTKKVTQRLRFRPGPETTSST
jgi:hypothetical protein